MVSHCVLRSAPSYLCDLCCQCRLWQRKSRARVLRGKIARRVLRSAARGELLVPRAQLTIMQ